MEGGREEGRKGEGKGRGRGGERGAGVLNYESVSNVMVTIRSAQKSARLPSSRLPRDICHAAGDTNIAVSPQ